MSLTSATSLHRAKELWIVFESDHEARAELDGRTLELGAHALLLLDAFARPTPIALALERLEPLIHGVVEWAEVARTLAELYDFGALRDGTSEPAPATLRVASYAASPIHVAMLGDRDRTSAFLAAIGKVVRPGDVVLEIGTGTGVLALGAARAGARHVYTVETSGIAPVAAALFAANGYDDRITLIRGWSTQVAIPEPADVLITETIGHEPLSEGILGIAWDARERLLKPVARAVPARLRILALPVSLPASEQRRWFFLPATAERWESWYGFRFAPLADELAGRTQKLLVAPRQARPWRRLSEPILLAELDVLGTRPLVDVEATVELERGGRLDGVLIYFEAELAPGIELSTHPDRASDQCSWKLLLWSRVPGEEVPAGERLWLRYARDSRQTTLVWRTGGRPVAGRRGGGRRSAQGRAGLPPAIPATPAALAGVLGGDRFLVKAVGRGGVLLDLERAVTLNLTPTARLLVEAMLAGTTSVAALADRLSADCDVAPATARRDVEAFVAKLAGALAP